ncbi:dihydrofolate reductase family protein [Flavivirga abyssicola]|uniref:dihydrofolate reductase family protein n=1 Tax=Flavivirga abyssicola TaxID=3063533 RepID=UPI0026DFC9D2|nr:dihydrofolate reductase family protein [Flavivirga sp. MEBiC07777]WVK14219.1 dihydrofolate reductase family protein [Flavivirga sp. MEBiC07777]
MRKLAILTFQSLDGVMQAPSDLNEDTSEGFTKGGWAKDHWKEVMEQVGREAMSQPYDLLLGRKTYELFSVHNSGIDSPLNHKTKYVITNTLSELNWQNSIPISGNVAKEVTKLKEKDGLLLQVHGSWELIQELLKHDLIDEFRLWTFPVLIGSGKKTFLEKNLPENLTLIKSETLPNGVIMSFYQKKI